MLRPALAACAVLAASVLPAAPTAPAAAEPVPPGGVGTAGPPYDYTTELMGQFELISLPDQAMVTRTEHGYLFRAGQQDTHLTVTLTEAGLLLADTGTASFKRVARACDEVPAETGVAAVCPVPAGVTAAEPLLLEVWPRLGDDYVDASTLPDTVAMTVLGDAGRETVRFGAGWDFFNGHTERDRVWGGGGNDWIRAGIGHDRVWGQAGDDQLVGVEGDDAFDGGVGRDRLGGGPGDDVLAGGPGRDQLLCDVGTDTALTDLLDRMLGCETVTDVSGS